MRLRGLWAPRGGRSECRPRRSAIALLDLDEVLHGADHAAHHRTVLPLHAAADHPEAERTERLAPAAALAAAASALSDLQRRLRRHRPAPPATSASRRPTDSGPLQIGRADV